MTERDTIDQTNLDYIGVRRPDPAPEYSPTVKMEDYSLDQRFRWAKEELDKLGETLTMSEIERLFRMPKRGAQRLVQRHLLPIGAVELVGRAYIVHTSGVRKLVGVRDE